MSTHFFLFFVHLHAGQPSSGRTFYLSQIMSIFPRAKQKTLSKAGILLQVLEKRCNTHAVCWAFKVNNVCDFTNSELVCSAQRWNLSAITHLRDLHGQLYKFSCVLTGAAAVTVQLQLVTAAILFLLVPLAGWLDVSVWGKTAAHSPLTSVR